MTFDPSLVGVKGSLFGFPYNLENAELVLVPIPWDATVSYGEGTAQGPAAILEASTQLDFNIPGHYSPWEYKVAMQDLDASIMELSTKTRSVSRNIIDKLENGEIADEADLINVNMACRKMIDWGYQQAAHHMDQGKAVGFVGGDHSTPLGLMQFLADRNEFGILQIDAHMDLREAYEGFIYSHASIMWNGVQLPGVQSLTQVGIRDYCEDEFQFVQQSDKPIHVFFDEEVRASQFQGQHWDLWVDLIIDTLPQNVYVSFDIDGLQPGLCPNTGTPVPGGLQFEEAIYLLNKVSRSGRKIIGFDLSEVAPGTNEWDAAVGARLLYRLVCAMGVSNSRIKVK